MILYYKNDWMIHICSLACWRFLLNKWWLDVVRYKDNVHWSEKRRDVLRISLEAESSCERQQSDICNAFWTQKFLSKSLCGGVHVVQNRQFWKYDFDFLFQFRKFFSYKTTCTLVEICVQLRILDLIFDNVVTNLSPL